MRYKDGWIIVNGVKTRMRLCFEDAHQSNEPPVTLGVYLRSKLWQLVYKYPRLNSLLIELCSLPGRIEFQRKLHPATENGRLHPVDFGPWGEALPNGSVVECKRTRARICDREQLSAILPQATRFEVWIFLQGWNCGENYVLRNHCLRTQNTDKAT